MYLVEEGREEPDGRYSQMIKREKRNVIVGQSGGPTAAINSSLAGVYRTAKDRGYKTVYGMLHGVQGLHASRRAGTHGRPLH